MSELSELTKEDAFQPPFKPYWGYNVKEDQIEAYWEDAACFGEKISKNVTLMRATDGGRIVGVKLHGL